MFRLGLFEFLFILGVLWVMGKLFSEAGPPEYKHEKLAKAEKEERRQRTLGNWNKRLLDNKVREAEPEAEPKAEWPPARHGAFAAAHPFFYCREGMDLLIELGVMSAEARAGEAGDKARARLAELEAKCKKCEVKPPPEDETEALLAEVDASHPFLKCKEEEELECREKIWGGKHVPTPEDEADALFENEAELEQFYNFFVTECIKLQQKEREVKPPLEDEAEALLVELEAKGKEGTR